METLLHFSMEYFDLFLIGILILLATFIMSIFIKRKSTLIAVSVVLIFTTIVFVNQLKYITLAELYSDQLNENSDVKSITITINEKPGYLPSENTKIVTIEKEEIIDRILEDISAIELKKDDEIKYFSREYQIEIIVTNKVREDHFSTTVVQLELDKHYLNEYKIVNESNHLKTIEYISKNMDLKDIK